MFRASASDPFEMSLSQRLGRTDQKEQYAYFYKYVPNHYLNICNQFLNVYARKPRIISRDAIDTYDISPIIDDFPNKVLVSDV